MSLSLMPMLIVAFTAVIAMLGIAIKRTYFGTALISVIGLNVALVYSLLQLFGVVSFELTSPLFVLDRFALFNIVVILVSALACMTLAYRYFDSFSNNKEELYVLMLVSTLGALLMVSASHLASFFMALELLSVPMYGMIGYAYLKSKSLEAALKYLILSAAASATLLMGMAFVFVALGSLQFTQMQAHLLSGLDSIGLVMVGGVMIICAIAFKLSLAPFHMWAADVYEGAPAPITNFLASISKVAMMALALRFFAQSSILALPALNTVLTIMIAISIIVGNLLALYQDNLKRMLAFSSVAHMGYALIAAMSLGAGSAGIVSVYMATYALTSIGAFGVVVLMTGGYGEHDRNALTDKIEDEADNMAVYQGLFWRRPVLTSVMTLMLLSMAGLPLTAGFITKMQVLFAAIEGTRFWLAGLLIVGSAIGLYYYLKVLLIMFKRPKTIIPFDVTADWRYKVNGLMVLLITAIVLVLGILPNSLLYLASTAHFS